MTKIRKILEKYAYELKPLPAKIIDEFDFDKLEIELGIYFADKMRILRRAEQMIIKCAQENEGIVKFTNPMLSSDAIKKAIELQYPKEPISESEWDKSNWNAFIIYQYSNLKKSKRKWFKRKKDDDNFIDKWFKKNARKTKRT